METIRVHVHTILRGITGRAARTTVGQEGSKRVGNTNLQKHKNRYQLCLFVF